MRRSISPAGAIPERGEDRPGHQCARPRVCRCAWTGCRLIEAGEVVYAVVDTAVPVSDADDIAILQTAATGKAEVICTLDRQLFQPEVVAWCQEPGIRVEGDVELLRRL